MNNFALYKCKKRQNQKTRSAIYRSIQLWALFLSPVTSYRVIQHVLSSSTQVADHACGLPRVLVGMGGKGITLTKVMRLFLQNLGPRPMSHPTKWMPLLIKSEVPWTIHLLDTDDHWGPTMWQCWSAVIEWTHVHTRSLAFVSLTF